MPSDSFAPGTIGELFMLGFRGTHVPDWLREFSRRFGLGGVILFDYDWATRQYDRNVHSPAQVAELCAELASLPSPPLVYVDQEGGRVRRLKDKLGFAPLPSALDVCALPDAEAAGLLKRSFAELVRLGINVNLAPVVDLNTNPDNPDIGVHGRSYSADPAQVRRMARLVDAAAREAGLGLCLKHFPGIGGASVNSHDAIMDLGPSLRDDQLSLFYELGAEIESGAILVSHGFVPQWDPNRPACLSPAAVQRLRKKLPNALLVSDDLQMQGLQKRFGTAEAVPMAIAAGIDVLILGNNLLDQEGAATELAERLEAAVRSDARLADNVQGSLRRIGERKARYIGLRQRYGQSGLAQLR